MVAMSLAPMVVMAVAFPFVVMVIAGCIRIIGETALDVSLHSSISRARDSRDKLYAAGCKSISRSHSGTSRDKRIDIMLLQKRRKSLMSACLGRAYDL